MTKDRAVTAEKKSEESLVSFSEERRRMKEQIQELTNENHTLTSANDKLETEMDKLEGEQEAAMDDFRTEQEAQSKELKE